MKGLRFLGLAACLTLFGVSHASTRISTSAAKAMCVQAVSKHAYRPEGQQHSLTVTKAYAAVLDNALIACTVQEHRSMNQRQEGRLWQFMLDALDEKEPNLVEGGTWNEFATTQGSSQANLKAKGPK